MTAPDSSAELFSRIDDPYTISADTPWTIVGDEGQLTWHPDLTDLHGASETKDANLALVLHFGDKAGFLSYPPQLEDKIATWMSGFTPPFVPISFAFWMVTQKRDTVPDLIAMCVSVSSRPRMDEAAYQIMCKAIPALLHPDNNRDDVIY